MTGKQARRIHVARHALVLWAIDRHAAGADWADMIHFAASVKLAGFVTLDCRLARSPGDRTPIPIETLA